jgi:RNA polymerase sigma-70 factor (ECF subfamily)
MPPHDDEDSFKTDLVALIPFMRAFARSLCRDPTEAEDMTQNALAKAWAGRGGFERGTNLKAWTFMILRNEFYSEKRRTWRSCQLDPEMAEQTLKATTNATAGLELDELRRAMAMLPDEQREALVLIGAAGLSYAEASVICGVPVGTVKSRVSRARDGLALIFAEGEITADGKSPHEAFALILQQADHLRLDRCA